MPQNTDKPKGPPAAVLEKLVDIHRENGTLDNVLGSAIGDNLRTALGELAALSGRSDPTGLEPWSFDGAALALLADINPGTGDSYAREFIVFDGSLFLRATDSTFSNMEVWRIDPDGTLTEIEINPSDTSGSVTGAAEFTVFNGSLYLAAFDGTDHELWRIDPDNSKHKININTNDGTSLPSSDPSDLFVFNDALYFGATDDGVDRELWRVNADGSVDQFDINQTTPLASSNPVNFFEFNGSLYFAANGGTGRELWRLDADDTLTMIDVDPVGDSAPGESVEFAGAVYFAASFDGNRGLARLDSDGNVTEVVFAESANANVFTFDAAELDGFLYLSATNDDGDRELWKIDADGNNTEIEVNLTGSSEPTALTVFDGALYFSATSDDGDRELWRLGTDGTLTEIDFFDYGPGSSSNAAPLGVVNDTLAIKVDLDLDNDGVADRTVLMAATGEAITVGDFTLIDDVSGTFEPVSSLFLM